MSPPPLSVAPPLSEVIERLGFGAAQLRAGLLGGGIYCACGAQMLLISTITGAISEELGLHAWQRGSLVSAVFIGIFVGNAISGPIGDSVGRRIPILLAYTGIASFSALSACAESYAGLCGIRLLVGACVGLGTPAFNALLTEVCPTYWRIAMQGACQSLFTVGEVFSVLCVWDDDPYMRHSSWRWLLVMGTLPSLLFGALAFFFLHQSPHYLAAEGDIKAAREVLKSIAADNGKPDACVDFKAAPKRASAPGAKSAGPFALIFSRKYAYSTIVVIYSCFVLNLTFYGTLYAMPQIIGGGHTRQVPALTMLLVALYEFPGIVLAVICGMMFPRKPVMVVYLATVSASLLAFAVGAAGSTADVEDGWSHALLQGGFIGIKGFGSIGYVVVYQYAAEIYPTMARTTGSGVSMAGGRVGGLTAPLIFEWLLSLTDGYEAFFHLIAVLCLLDFFLVVFLPFETFGKTLPEDIDDDDLKADAAYLPLTG